MSSCAPVILYDRGPKRVQGEFLRSKCSLTLSKMRVIAGKFRSRPLQSLRGLEIRPTSDRLRETLFNILTAGNPEALEGSIWVDLFAGTGAVGIEALSRGAAMVYFAESARPSTDLIRRNLECLNVPEGFRVMQQDSGHAISQLDREGIQAGFVFLDPPYSEQHTYGQTLEALAVSKLASTALVIAEHEKRFDPGEGFESLRRVRKLQQGDAALSFYRHS
jgi:16S rRNA (guanine966-N2)-methyltransferase